MILLYLPDIDLSIVALILLGIVFFLYKKRFDVKEKQTKLFLMLLVATASTIILEILDRALLGGGSAYYIYSRIVNCFGFMISPVIPFVWQLYLVEYFKLKEKIKYLSIPIIINSIICLLSLKWELVFFVNEFNYYKRGPLFGLPMTITLCYLIYNLYIILRNKDIIEAKEYINLLWFEIIPIVAAMIQIIFPELMLIWPSVAMALIIHYIYLQERLLRYDSLTGVWNRMSFERYVTNHLLKKRIKFGLVIIDLDDFKAINDTFGHTEGDEALKKMAIFLSKYFKNKGQVVRTGGDEFVVIVFEENKINLETLLNPLKLELDKYNQLLRKQYSLKFSYGFDLFNEDYEDFEQFFNQVDTLMYEQKKIKSILNKKS